MLAGECRDECERCGHRSTAALLSKRNKTSANLKFLQRVVVIVEVVSRIDGWNTYQQASYEAPPYSIVQGTLCHKEHQPCEAGGSQS